MTPRSIGRPAARRTRPIVLPGRSPPVAVPPRARTRRTGGRDRRAARSPRPRCGRSTACSGAIGAAARRGGGPGHVAVRRARRGLARARPARRARRPAAAAATGSPRPPGSPPRTVPRSPSSASCAARGPDDPRVQVLVGTPSRLSFPSAHATSTTAAAVLFGGLARPPAAAVLVPPDGAVAARPGRALPDRRAAGSVLGAAVAAAARRPGSEGPRDDRHRRPRRTGRPGPHARSGSPAACSRRCARGSG